MDFIVVAEFNRAGWLKTTTVCLDVQPTLIKLMKNQRLSEETTAALNLLTTTGIWRGGMTVKRMLLFLGFVIVAALVTQAQNQAANQKNDTAGPKPSTAQSQSVSGQTSQSGQSKGVNQDEHKPSQHHMHWHFAPFISAGYAHFSGPLFYGAFWPYGFYPATFPYAGDFYPYGFYYPANTFDYHEGRGQVKLSGASKQAQVYLNGAYAGTVDHAKNMWLDPGVYNLTISGQQKFEKRIYVLSGKTLKIDVKSSGAKDF